VRNGVLAGVAAFALLAAGVGLGHAAWTSGGTSNLSAASSSGTTRLPSGSGSTGSGSGNSGSSSSPFGNGSPFGGGFSGNSGNTGSGSSGSSGSSGPSDTSAIASKVDPGLVDINTTLGYSQEQAAGTGIVLSASGVILTNNHVVDGATSISVTDVGNQKTYTASVVGYDRTSDVAVLQLHNASGLQTATLGNSSNASVGEDIVGIGNAGGTGGTPSAAGGTVTALNQSITASDEGDGTSEQLSGLIETNANIQPGDSGGALVNTSGQVLGMDTAASAGFTFQSGSQSSGTQGFAIPINTALNVARAIEAGSASATIHIGETAFLGVEINPDSSSSGNSGSSGFGSVFGGNSGNTGSSVSGASVAGVVTNGPAQTAGLAQGDTITSLGGKTIGSADALTNAMASYHPGDKVAVGWTDSSGQTHTATVQLSSGPPQ
jgi:S1-C subfamily serine protease